MLSHLYGMGAHGNAVFPDKCNRIGYTARGLFRVWDRHWTYWHMKMYINIHSTDEATLRFVHEEVLRKVAGREVLTRAKP
eukprot:2191170-Rhodomonas_salina.1